MSWLSWLFGKEKQDVARKKRQCLTDIEKLSATKAYQIGVSRKDIAIEARNEAEIKNCYIQNRRK